MLEARARLSDPKTSHVAAATITPDLGPIQRLVLQFAAAKGPRGFIDPDMEMRFASHGPSTVRTRRCELVRKGLIMKTDQFRRLGAHKREFIVWKITATGIAEAKKLRHAQ